MDNEVMDICSNLGNKNEKESFKLVWWRWQGRGWGGGVIWDPSRVG